MTQEFAECLNKYTKEHHESSGKATTPEEYQKFTCKLLSDTAECGELWKRCHSASEVRSIQDTHIQARITQFRDNTEGIDVFKCPVVEEYINSGRADQVDQSTEGACSVSQVSEVQKQFQDCSHDKSLKLYDEIELLKEGRFSRDTNDLEDELNREDSETASLDPMKDIKPRLCSALKAIAKECIESFNKCFSREDSNQIKRQHIEQMQKYYAKIYPGVGNLTDCPGLDFTEEGNVYDDEDYNYEEDYEKDYEDEEDYYSDKIIQDQTTSSTTAAPPFISSADFKIEEPMENLEEEEEQEEVLPYPDPEGNAVIAEPPVSGERASQAPHQAAGLSSLCLALFVLCQISIVLSS